MPKPLRMEPISPELVLVSPDLRGEALRTLSEPVWAAYFPPATVRAMGPPRRRPARPLEPLSLLRFVAATLSASVVLTLALTLVADAVR